MANGESAITRTRGSSAPLDVIDDRVRIWLGDEGCPVGVVPGTLLMGCRGGEISINTSSACGSPVRRSVPVELCPIRIRRGRFF
jgi:hypothetical protein